MSTREFQTRELVVEGTPRSLQGSGTGLRAWRQHIIGTVHREIPVDMGPIEWEDVAVRLFHFCPEWGDNDGDLDNIAKPILDALCESRRVLFNDNQVKEILLRRIEWKRRNILTIDGATPRLAVQLDRAIRGDGPQEFVYIWVTTQFSLESLP